MNKKPTQIFFAPGCFDNFEGTQQELDQLIADIQSMVETGEIFDRAVPLEELESSDFDLLPESVKSEILREADDRPPRTLQ